MKNTKETIAALGKWLRRRVSLIVIIAVVFIVGYWLRGAIAPSMTSQSHDSDTMTGAEPGPQVWTCSMHPQIKLPKPGLCPICNMDLIPLATDPQEQADERQLVVSEYAKKLMEIQTVPVERKFVSAEIRMVGKVD